MTIQFQKKIFLCIVSTFAVRNLPKHRIVTNIVREGIKTYADTIYDTFARTA